MTEDHGAMGERSLQEFNAVLEVAPASPWFDAMGGLCSQWLRSKNLPSGGTPPFEHHQNGASVAIDAFASEGRRAFRLELFEIAEGIIWTSEVLAVDEGAGEGLIAITVRASDGRYVARPRIARSVLAELEIVDGGEILVADTWLVGRAQLGELVSLLCDEARRAMVFVATSAPDTDPDLVRGIMQLRVRDVAGLARSVVLDAEATVVFNKLAGASHAIPRGAVRCFAPHVAFRNEADGVRHPVLGRALLTSMSQSAVVRLFGGVVRRAASGHPKLERIEGVREVFERRKRGRSECAQVSSAPST